MKIGRLFSWRRVHLLWWKIENELLGLRKPVLKPAETSSVRCEKKKKNWNAKPKIYESASSDAENGRTLLELSQVELKFIFIEWMSLNIGKCGGQANRQAGIMRFPAGGKSRSERHQITSTVNSCDGRRSRSGARGACEGGRRRGGAKSKSSSLYTNWLNCLLLRCALPFVETMIIWLFFRLFATFNYNKYYSLANSGSWQSKWQLWKWSVALASLYRQNHRGSSPSWENLPLYDSFNNKLVLTYQEFKHPSACFKKPQMRETTLALPADGCY